MQTSNVNFGLDIRARILCLDANNSFLSSLLCSSSPCATEEGLRYSRSRLHIGWLVGFRVLRQIKKVSSYDVFREETVHEAAKKGSGGPSAR